MEFYDLTSEDLDYLASEEEETQQFTIDNDALADWAVRKIQEEKAENKRLHEIAEEQIGMIEAKLQTADNRLTSRTSFLTSKLRQYFDRVPHKETKTQAKYQLLSGALVMTKAKETLEQDDEALLQYLKASGNSEFIKTVEKPAWGEYKKRLTVVDGNVVDAETGDFVDGVRAVQKAETFDVK